MSTITTDDSLKMIRETLCVAQTHVGLSDDPRKREHIDRMQRLISDIDRRRPLGRNGRHGDLHTACCGCEDVDAG
jgi:hypothetical protein